MPFYSVDGRVVEAGSPDEALALVGEGERFAGQNPAMQFGEAALRAIPEAGGKVGNMLGLGNVSPENFGDEAIARQHRMAQERRGTNAGYLGGFTGDVLATAPVGGAGRAAVQEGLTMLPGAGRALSAAVQRFAPVVEGAFVGAGMAQPGERGKGAMEGAGWGGALPLASAALKRVAEPVRAIPEALRLARKKVNLTTGELNPEGWLNQVEEAAQSLPGVGPLLARQRRGAWQDVQRATSEAAGPPGFQMPAGVTKPDELYAQAERAYGPAYDEALTSYTNLEPRIVRTAGGDVPLHKGAWGGGAAEDATRGNFPQGVTDAERKQARQIIRDQMTTLPRGPVTGAQLQTTRSNLRTAGRERQGNERYPIKSASRTITEAIESQISPQDAAKLRELDRAYPNLAVLRDAVTAGKSSPQGFSPQQLGTAVARNTERGDYARGGGPLREIADDAGKVFERRSNPTGERMLTLPGTVMKYPIGAGLAALNKVPLDVRIGNTVPQRTLKLAMAELDRLQKTNPRAAAYFRNLIPAYQMAGE
jgi:hypothetical protein